MPFLSFRLIEFKLQPFNLFFQLFKALPLLLKVRLHLPAIDPVEVTIVKMLNRCLSPFKSCPCCAVFTYLSPDVFDGFSCDQVRFIYGKHLQSEVLVAKCLQCIKSLGLWTIFELPFDLNQVSDQLIFCSIVSSLFIQQIWAVGLYFLKDLWNGENLFRRI